MDLKKYKGKLISVKFSDRKDLTWGIVVNTSNEWTLMINNCGDYLIDGYIIFRHKNIIQVNRGPKEKFSERVIRLKETLKRPAKSIPLENLESMLRHLSIHYEIFALTTNKEGVFYMGMLEDYVEGNIILLDMDTRGFWSDSSDFKEEDIRFIEFDNDYINSLKLINQTYYN